MTPSTAVSATTAAAAAPVIPGPARGPGRNDDLRQRFRVDAFQRDRVADVFLDLRQGEGVVLAGEADGFAAGAQAIETNSFAANRVKLRKVGLEDQHDA